MTASSRPTRIEVIGGVRVFVDGNEVKLRPQVQRLAAILVAARRSGIEGSVLAEELWAGSPPPQWNAAVRNAMSTFRSEVGQDIVQTMGGRYALQLSDECVDAWHVLTPEAKALTDVELRRSFRRFQPFDGLELTPVLQETVDALKVARLRVADTTESDADPSFVASLMASVRADPFDDATTIAVLRMLMRIGKATEAHALVSRVEQAYATELQAAPPAAVIDATRRAEAGPPVVQHRGLLQLPAVVGEMTQRPMTNRHRDLARATAQEIVDGQRPPRLSILGVAGCGKSRLSAEIGRQLHDAGIGVIFAAAVGDETSAYSPFLTASPAFRQGFLELDEPSESSVWALWSSILDGFAQHASRVAVIIDDAQRLDRGSIRLLQFVHRMQPLLPVTTIVVGRPSTGEPDWTAFELELLSDDRTEAVDVPPLEVEEITELIGVRWPRANQVIRREAAVEIAAASAGLPMVVVLMIEALSGPTLRRLTSRQSRHVDLATERLRDIPEPGQKLLAAATLLESTFSQDELAALTETSPDEVAAVLVWLDRTAVLVGSDRPGTYRFMHDLLRQGATELVSSAIRARWSLRLMETTDDPIRLARLAQGAKELMQPTDVATILANGASEALRRNLTRQAIDLAEEAIALESGSTHAALACLSTAQVRLGALDDAAMTRAALLDRTTTPEEHARATLLLLESVIYVEADNPTGIKAADFDRLETSGLSDEQKLNRAAWVARLANWEGDRARRDAELALARSLQRTDDEAARVFYADWRSEAHTLAPKWFDDVAELRRRVEGRPASLNLLLIEALELAAAARWKEAESGVAELHRAAEALSDAGVQWLALLASSGLAFSQGNLEDARADADAALAFGMLYARPLAPAARAAQSFTDALHTGSTARWLKTVESLPPDLLRTTMAMTAVGRAHFEVGSADQGWRIVEPIVTSMLNGEHRIARSVIAILAPLIRQRATPTMLRQCIETVRPFGDRWIVTGAGFGVHGPASRTVAILEGDRRGLHAVRRTLIDQPAAGQKLWTSVIERDIARLDRG